MSQFLTQMYLQLHLYLQNKVGIHHKLKMYYLPKDIIQLQWAVEQGESSNENVQEGNRDEEQVHRTPENYIETPKGDRDHEQVQRHPESQMQATRGRNSCRQVQRDATNCL